MLKKTRSSDISALNMNDNSKLASSKNDSNNEIEFGNNNVEYTKKLG